MARVAGKIVDPILISQWYKTLEDAGFNDIETFDRNMEPIIHSRSHIRPALKRESWQCNFSLFLKRQGLDEESWWALCKDFYHRWQGWANKRSRPHHRMIWECYIEGSYSAVHTAKVIEEKLGVKIALQTIHNQVSKFKKEMKKWLHEHKGKVSHLPVVE